MNITLISFAILFAAQVCFSAEWGWAGLALVVAGWAALWRAPARAAETGRMEFRWKIVVGVVLFGVALAFRLWRLGEHPPVWWDEGVEAYDVRCLLAGRPLEPLSGISYHRAPLWLAILMATAKVAGTSFAALKSVSVLTGSLTVVLVFVLGARMFGPVAGILAGAFLCFHPWQLHQSRMLHGSILVPAMGALVVLLCRSPRFPLMRRSVLAGLVGGVNVYGYAASFHLPLLAGLALALPSGDGESSRRRWKAAALALAIPALCALPATGLMPDYWDKTTSVSALSAPRTLAGNLAASLGMFNYRGDPDMRHQYPAGAPALGPLIGPVFLLGAGILLRSPRSATSILLLGWMLLAMLPGVATEGGEANLFRMVGVPPALALVTASGGVALFHALGSRVGMALLAALWGVTAAMDARTYFREYPADRATSVWFRTWAREAGEELRTRASHAPFTLSPVPGLVEHPMEKWFLFDAVADGRVRFAPGNGTGVKTLRVFRDGFGNPQAVLRRGRAGRMVYRTVMDICGEGDALLGAGNWRQALSLFRGWDAVMRGSMVLRERAAFALLKGGRNREAVEAFWRAIGPGPGLPSSWDGMASAFYRMGEYDKAERALRRALELEPGSREFADDLARVQRARSSGKKGG